MTIKLKVQNKTRQYEEMKKDCEEKLSENRVLKLRNDALLNQLDCVNWYIKYMEDGKDPKFIAQDYFKLKKEMAVLEEKLIEKTHLFNVQNAVIENKLAEARIENERL